MTLLDTTNRHHINKHSAMAGKAKKHNKILDFCRRQDWEGFLMGFISVVLGIVITFGGEALIAKHNEENDLKDVLVLVRDELQNDVKIMNETNEKLELENRASLYLMKYYDNFEACEWDSMKLYCNAPMNQENPSSSQDALELLKTSSLLQKIKDKNLALDIIKAYKALQVEKDNIDFYNDKKKELLDNAMQEEAKAVFAMPHFTPAQMWGAITSTTDGRKFLREINISVTFGFGHEETKECVEKVIADIDKYINN